MLGNNKKVLTVLIAVTFILSAAVLFCSAAQARRPSDEGEVDVIIGFHDRPDMQIMSDFGVQVRREFDIIDAVSATVPEDVLQRAEVGLLQHSAIKYIEPNYEVFLLGQEVPWGIDRVFADEEYPFDSWNETRARVWL